MGAVVPCHSASVFCMCWRVESLSIDNTAEITLRHTPLFSEHQRLKARLAPFGEWEKPIDYGSIIEEHNATRRKAGLFDLSHMGEFIVSGPQALELISVLLTNDPRVLNPGQGQYALMCRDDGTIVDDVIVYKLPGQGPTPYLLVVNAGNMDKDWQWVQQVCAKEGLAGDSTVENRSDQTALIAVQGPLAEEIVATSAEESLANVTPFSIREAAIRGIPCMIARTGYTGEDGFEIFVSAERALDLWTIIHGIGGPSGLRPVGLGARDTLRLEARLPLYGNDIDDTTTPLEAGLGRWVKLDKPRFCGKEAIETQKREGIRRTLVGLKMTDRSVPRAHYPVLSPVGAEIGIVTSGSFSPTLGYGIALAYVPPAYAEVGSAVQVDIRSHPHPALVVKTPFYRRRKATTI